GINSGANCDKSGAVSHSPTAEPVVAGDGDALQPKRPGRARFGRRSTLIALGVLVVTAVYLGVLYKSDRLLADVYVRLPSGEVRRASPESGGVFYEANIHPD